MRTYRSIDDARAAFDRYAQIEPRLLPLWDLCACAEPTVYVDESADVYDPDPFEADSLADKPTDGWCAEDFFLEHVKSRLLLLVGQHRVGPLHELHGREAFEEVYDLLLNWALHRPCACCAPQNNDAPMYGGDPAHPST
jgi:hypothetical protein